MRHIASNITGGKGQYASCFTLDYRTHEQNILSILQDVEVHCNNRIWRAIVNSRPLMNQPAPSSYSAGSTEEARLAIDYGWPVLMLWYLQFAQY